MTASAVETAILVLSHESSFAVSALLALLFDCPILVDLEKLQELKLLLLTGVRDPLLGCVGLLLPLLLLGTVEAGDDEDGGFALNGVVTESQAVLEDIASEDQSQEVGWDATLCLDHGPNALNIVGGLHVQCQALPRRQRSHEDLHHEGPTQPPITLKKMTEHAVTV